MFSSLTSLRCIDVKAIRWCDLRTNSNGEAELRYKDTKTKEEITSQISKEALKFLPERENAQDEDNIFVFPRNDHANKLLKEWVKAAGITKKITFHCSRHTAGTLSLTQGNSIEATSKIMGHKKISTTQIYAKIVNETLRISVNKQDGLFDGLID